MTTVRLEKRKRHDVEGEQALMAAANKFFNLSFAAISTVEFFLVECANWQSQDEEIFYDPILEELIKEESGLFSDYHFVASVSYRPGVTDNQAQVVKEALGLFSKNCRAQSGMLYYFKANQKIDLATITKLTCELWANEIIEEVAVYSLDDFIKLERFSKINFREVVLNHSASATAISLELSDEELIALSDRRCLALSLSEMKHIKNYFATEEVIESRIKLGLGPHPTDVELEMLAQTWSEHCKHKIFSADISYHEKLESKDYQALGNLSISEGLYRRYIKGATKKIAKARELDWLISVFSDNAGIVRFDNKIDYCIKVETHNTPSALDPYGGALTGILGVNRDILGTGMGAKPMANLDVFCLPPPHWPSSSQLDKLPAKMAHPRRILEGVHRGVLDGGNKSGIPTVNGAFFFDPSYLGKPLVFVGTVGVMPQQLTDGSASSKKEIVSGDRVVMIGGAIGCDGIHGATFSSQELSETSPSSAVQIGDPLTQKRMHDFILEARDVGLYRAITDNGAGGLSSSVGEMALHTNGVTIDLSACPVKYRGLAPYELLISESQERMTLAVSPEKLSDFLSLANRRGVLATEIGQFNSSGFFEACYEKKLVARLSLDFLHHSLPAMKLEARWNGPRSIAVYGEKIEKKEIVPTSNFLSDVLLQLLSSPNISSKESWVRQYDHEVQGATAIKPFGGKKGHGVADGAILWAYPHDGNIEEGVALGCGLAPRYSWYDPYLMAQYAVDEAVRNVVSSGGDLSLCCLLDNFCWPDPVESEKNPDGAYKLGQLVRAAAGLHDIALAYGLPLVSGKDSMKNDFKGKTRGGDRVEISVVPTLLITCLSKASMNYLVTSEFKDPGDLIFLLGKNGEGMLASEFAQLYTIENNASLAQIPQPFLKDNFTLYHLLRRAQLAGLIKSSHDLSDGGLLVAMAESMIGGELGGNIALAKETKNDLSKIINFCFGEASGRFLVTVAANRRAEFLKCFEAVEVKELGVVTQKKELEVLDSKNKNVISLSVDKLK